MGRSQFDRERAIQILVDAAAVGDETACAHWKVSGKTLQRYRKRLADDPELSRAVRMKSQELDREWRTARRRFLRRAIGKLEALVEQATVGQMRDVTGAIKILGELEITAGMVADEPDPAQPHEQAPTQIDRPAVH